MPQLHGQHYAAFLFDMDGTLLNSIPAVERVWGQWASRHGIDATHLLATLHGVRAEDTIRRYLKDEQQIRREAQWILEAECEDTAGVTPLPGIHRLLATLSDQEWAIVTSAPRALALTRLAAAGIPLPTHVLTAEDVKQGKPNPEGFLLAAQRLGVEIRHCIVFEDSPAGVTAGRVAGASLAIIGGHVAPMPGELALPDYLGCL